MGPKTSGAAAEKVKRELPQALSAQPPNKSKMSPSRVVGLSAHAPDLPTTRNKLLGAATFADRIRQRVACPFEVCGRKFANTTQRQSETLRLRWLMHRGKLLKVVCSLVQWASPPTVASIYVTCAAQGATSRWCEAALSSPEKGNVRLQRSQTYRRCFQ